MKTLPRRAAALSLLCLLAAAPIANAAKRIAAAEPARPGALGLVDVVGLWHGVASVDDIRWERNADGQGFDRLIHEKRVGAQYYLFMPDGTYTSDIPDFGIDASTLSRVSEYMRGTYSVAGDTITMKGMATGARAQQVQVVKGVMKMPEGDLKRRPAVDGITIEGSFVATDPNADAPTPKGRERTISFDANGGFSDKGAVNVIGNARRGGRPLSFYGRARATTTSTTAR